MYPKLEETLERQRVNDRASDTQSYEKTCGNLQTGNLPAIYQWLKPETSSHFPYVPLLSITGREVTPSTQLPEYLGGRRRLNMLYIYEIAQRTHQHHLRKEGG
jgi:hypothetical protein